MATPKLTLYVDVISPFGYLAYYITRNSPVFKKCEINYIPILLGGVMKATGNLTPLSIKNKDKWINQERRRWMKNFNVPMLAEPPVPFPQPSLNAQRALCAIEIGHPEKLTECITALYHAFWVEGQTIGKLEVVGPVLAKVLGEKEAEKMVKAASSPEAKKRLNENSEKALADGAFGLPYFVATNAKGEKETFWGVDHIGQLVDHLELERKDAPGFRALL